MLNLKNMILNRRLFVNSEATIEFVASKQVQEWFWILISSPGRSRLDSNLDSKQVPLDSHTASTLEGTTKISCQKTTSQNENFLS